MTARQPQLAVTQPRAGSDTQAMRLLGDRAAARYAVESEQWDLPPSVIEAWDRPSQSAAHYRQMPHYGTSSWQMTPQFALYAELDGLAREETPEPTGISPIFALLARAVKRLVLPVAIVVISLGLFAIISSSVFARGVGGQGRQEMRMSGYWESRGASAAAAQPGDAVPVIEARSDTQAVASVQPVASGAPHDVMSGPSISVAQIDRVLAQYGSPAAGKGQVLYDLGVRYGVDPAYALAFFVHESGCGTKGVARSTRSLGNIRWTQGYENFSGYRKYDSWEAGMEDWYKLITELYVGGWGLRTVDKIIPVYAPWGDGNNPPAYIRAVKTMVDGWRGK